ncbi:MAG: methanogenesis marker 12 protein [Methanotrichaceae archaeon]
MFLGIDHGTTSIRFASAEEDCFELGRIEASSLSSEEIIERIKHHLNIEKAELVALTYSMGDGLTRIVKIEDASNRGLIQQDGAGQHVGGGTKVFDAIKNSGWPAVLLPGIHRRSEIDPRLKVFSHGMSPEKVGLAYGIFRRGVKSFIVSDASSNTVTFGVLNGKIVGAIDAPIFAPGLTQGPLDVEAIRNVDAGLITANEAFTRGGILQKMGIGSLEDCSIEQRNHCLESLALFVSMEISAMAILLRDLGEQTPRLFLAGSPANLIERRVSEFLDSEISSLDRCAAAQGCAWIAQDIFAGAESILGIEVDERARHSSNTKCVNSLIR